MNKLILKMSSLYKKELENKVWGHLELVAMCNARENTIFTGKSNFTPIRILVITLVNARFWSVQTSNVHLYLPTHSTRFVEWVTVPVHEFTTEKMCFLGIKSIFLDFDTAHLRSFFTTKWFKEATISHWQTTTDYTSCVDVLTWWEHARYANEYWLLSHARRKKSWERGIVSFWKSV